MWETKREAQKGQSEQKSCGGWKRINPLRSRNLKIMVVRYIKISLIGTPDFNVAINQLYHKVKELEEERKS